MNVIVYCYRIIQAFIFTFTLSTTDCDGTLSVKSQTAIMSSFPAGWPRAPSVAAELAGQRRGQHHQMAVRK